MYCFIQYTETNSPALGLHVINQNVRNLTTTKETIPQLTLISNS